MNKKTRAKYPSDLTDEEWEEIRPLFKGMRQMQCCTVNKTGCQWRQLPHDFPPYATV